MTTPKQAQANKTASKLAQLVGEAIVHASPHTSREQAQAQQAQTDAWLEGLESHLAGFVGPFVRGILDNSDPPPAIRALLEEAENPQAQFSAVIEQIFVFGIVSQLLGTSIQPFLQGVTNDLWTTAVGAGIHVPVSPAIIATAAGRGLNLGDPPTLSVPDWAHSEAAKSGLSADDINLQASLVGLPPALQELFELYRREVISLDDVKTGLREGDFRDDWIDRTVQLAHGWLTPLDFVRAAVQAQMPYADAAEWATKTGLDTSTPLPVQTGSSEATPDMFGLAFSIAGRPPGPQEVANMALRGIVPWDGTGADATTFQQAIAESDVKTKWTESLRKLATYYPPPEQVNTLLERGAITDAQAAALWEAHGVPAEIAKAYTYVSDQQHVRQDKLEAKGTITTAYYDQLIDNQTATALLGDLGFRGAVAAEMLAVVDFRREIKAINSVVSRISSLYGAYKLSNAHAKQALIDVGVPDAQATAILASWDALRKEPVRLPTAAEIGLAYKYSTITEAIAIEALEALGYQPRDAVIVLSAHATVKVEPLPAAGSTVTG